MATPNVGILTIAGKALIDKANSGQAKISFSKVVFSSMDNAQLSDTQIKALTAIAPQEVVVSSPETTLDTNSGETRIRATGTNEKLADGVYVKTYGVFAKDDTGNEILYGVTVSPNPNYFPAYDGVTPQAVTYSYKTVIQETSNITMTNSNDVYVSQEDLTEAIAAIPLANKADDSKVVHNSGNEEIAGKKTFDTAPIDKTTGNPYITKDGVPAVPSTLADTTKPANFTNGLQSGGVDVATAADLKSIEDSAWRQLDNKYISANTGTLSSDTTILFRLDQIAKKIYLQGTVLVKELVEATITIDFSGIIKTITSSTDTLQYWGNNPSSSNWATTTGSKIVITTDDDGRSTILHSGAGTTKTAACVTYDELV